MPLERLRTIANGIFFSLLSYTPDFLLCFWSWQLCGWPWQVPVTHKTRQPQSSDHYECSPEIANQPWLGHCNLVSAEKKRVPLHPSNVCPLHFKNYLQNLNNVSTRIPLPETNWSYSKRCAAKETRSKFKIIIQVSLIPGKLSLPS